MTAAGPASQVSSTLKWGQLKRLEFIEFRLLWEGRVIRRGLREAFQISEQQASLDISRYLDAAPDNMAYDPIAKAYVRRPKFAPKFVADFTDRYLLQLHAVRSGIMAKEDSWFKKLPSAKVATLAHKPTPWRFIMGVLDAIRSGKEAVIEYRSLTGTTETQKHIAPHALGHGAGRWHVRAWSREHDNFRDYNLDRITSFKLLDRSTVNSECDRAWHTEFEMIIIPNPALPQGYRDTIAEERGMVNNELRCSLPVSMCFYLDIEYLLDLAEKVEFGDGAGQTVKAQRFHLKLKNRDAYEMAISTAKAETRAALDAARASAEIC